MGRSRRRGSRGRRIRGDLPFRFCYIVLCRVRLGIEGVGLRWWVEVSGW